MVSIIADNQEIERCIEKLVALSKVAGAEIAGDVSLKCLGGNMWVEANPGDPTREIIRMPVATLVPVEKFKLSLERDEIVIKSHMPDISDLRLAMMEEILELFNLTGKIAAHRKTSLWLQMAKHPARASLIRRVRQHDLHDDFERLAQAGDLDALTLKTFLKARMLGLKEASQADISLFLLPVIDFMDHYNQGAPFRVKTRENVPSLSVARAHAPLENQKVCYARYGGYDNFDAYLGYGFLDENIPFVRSVAATIELSGIGTIRIDSIPNMDPVESLPAGLKGLQLYLPSLNRNEDGTFTASTLVFPGPKAPRALRRVLHIVINSLGTGLPESRHHDLVLEAEDQLLRQNLAYYRELQETLEILVADDTAKKEEFASLFRLCAMQSARLESYKSFALSPEAMMR